MRFDVTKLEGITLAAEGISLDVRRGRATLMRKGPSGAVLVGVSLAAAVIGLLVLVFAWEGDTFGFVLGLLFLAFAAGFPVFTWSKRGTGHVFDEKEFRALTPIDWVILRHGGTLESAGLIAPLPPVKGGEKMRVSLLYPNNVGKTEGESGEYPMFHPRQMERLERMDDSRRRAVVRTLHELMEQELLRMEDDIARDGIHDDADVDAFLREHDEEMVISQCEAALSNALGTLILLRRPVEAARAVDVLHAHLRTPADAQRATETFTGQTAHWPESFRVEPAPDLGPLMRRHVEKGKGK